MAESLGQRLHDQLMKEADRRQALGAPMIVCHELRCKARDVLSIQSALNASKEIRR